MTNKECNWCKRDDKEIKEFNVIYFGGPHSDTRRMSYKTEDVCYYCQSGPFMYVDEDSVVKVQYKKLTFEEQIDISCGQGLKAPWMNDGTI